MPAASTPADIVSPQRPSLEPTGTARGACTDVVTAVRLMRMALALLDRVGERDASTLLQHAIDRATGALVPRTVEEAEASLDSAEARILCDSIRSHRA